MPRLPCPRAVAAVLALAVLLPALAQSTAPAPRRFERLRQALAGDLEDGSAQDDQAADVDPDRTAPQRGQGLFVAKTYMAKMGGTIAAENVPDGVRFVLTLPRA